MYFVSFRRAARRSVARLARLPPLPSRARRRRRRRPPVTLLVRAGQKFSCQRQFGILSIQIFLSKQRRSSRRRGWGRQGKEDSLRVKDEGHLRFCGDQGIKLKWLARKKNLPISCAECLKNYNSVYKLALKGFFLKSF